MQSKTNKSFNAKDFFRKAWKIGSYSSGYALGGGVVQVFTLYYMGFLMFGMGLPPLMAGAVIAIGKIWDGFIDPAMGLAVDNTKTRFGSCRPWFLISAVPIFFTYFMLWYCFGIGSVNGKFFYFLFAQILFSTAYSMGTVPYDALLPRMIDNYDERTNYSSARMVFSGIASVGGNYIYQLLIPVTKVEDYAGLDAQFMKLGLILGAVFAVPLLITFIGTKEKARPVNIEAQRNDSPKNLRDVFKNYGELLKSKIYLKCYLLTMLAAFIYYAMSISLVIFVLLVYKNPEYKITLGSLVIPFTLSFLVVNLRDFFEMGLFIPNVLIMKKYNKHRPFLIDLPLLFVGSAILLFVSPQVPLFIYLIGVGFIGAGVSCLNFVPNSLMPDLTDIDEMVSGKRREGTNAGLISLGRQVVQGLSFLVFGIVLKVFNLSEDNAASAEATFGNLAALKIMLCVIPIVGGAIMYIISRKYNLDAKSHSFIKAKIAEKHQSGCAEISADERKTLTDITGIPYEQMWIGRAENQAE
ncbi:MAG: MFS transporter [Clostridiales bacterium]|nr:MFS transporter [Clostridiales bacterium]